MTRLKVKKYEENLWTTASTSSPKSITPSTGSHSEEWKMKKNVRSVCVLLASTMADNWPIVSWDILPWNTWSFLMNWTSLEYVSLAAVSDSLHTCYSNPKQRAVFSVQLSLVFLRLSLPSSFAASPPHFCVSRLRLHVCRCRNVKSKTTNQINWAAENKNVWRDEYENYTRKYRPPRTVISSWTIC